MTEAEILRIHLFELLFPLFNHHCHVHLHSNSFHHHHHHRIQATVYESPIALVGQGLLKWSSVWRGFLMLPISARTILTTVILSCLKTILTIIINIYSLWQSFGTGHCALPSCHHAVAIQSQQPYQFLTTTKVIQRVTWSDQGLKNLVFTFHISLCTFRISQANWKWGDKTNGVRCNWRLQVKHGKVVTRQRGLPVQGQANNMFGPTTAIAQRLLPWF